jgi:hypothetical protein
MVKGQGHSTVYYFKIANHVDTFQANQLGLRLSNLKFLLLMPSVPTKNEPNSIHSVYEEYVEYFMYCCTAVLCDIHICIHINNIALQVI